MKKEHAYLASALALVILAGGGCININYSYQNPTTTPEKPVNNPPNNPPTTTPEKAQIEYKNNTYGFIVTLPSTWKGYKVVAEKWEGLQFNTGDQTRNTKLTEGPQISIRHPKWTKQKTRQDIPILIFTTQQWNDLNAEKFHLSSAAPILPSELTRNSKYVFALPARYNFAYEEGYEEVDELIQNKAVKAF